MIIDNLPNFPISERLNQFYTEAIFLETHMLQWRKQLSRALLEIRMLNLQYTFRGVSVFTHYHPVPNHNSGSQVWSRSDVWTGQIVVIKNKWNHSVTRSVDNENGCNFNLSQTSIARKHLSDWPTQFFVLPSVRVIAVWPAVWPAFDLS